MENQASRIEKRISFWKNITKEELTEQRALLLLCFAYRRQQKQKCIVDVRVFEYQNKKDIYIKTDSLKMALNYASLTEIEKNAYEKISGNIKILHAGDLDAEGKEGFTDELFWAYRAYSN